MGLDHGVLLSKEKEQLQIQAAHQLVVTGNSQPDGPLLPGSRDMTFSKDKSRKMENG